MLSVFWFYFPVCVKLLIAATEDYFWLWWGVKLALCTSSLMICDCFSFLCLLAPGISLSLFWALSPGIAASAVSSLNLHLIVKWICILQVFFFFKISVARVKVKSAFQMSLWLAQSFFIILCMSLISSLKNHISWNWHIWALSVIRTYWFTYPLMKNKGVRSHTSTSLHERGSLPWLTSACALCLLSSSPSSESCACLLC